MSTRRRGGTQPSPLSVADVVAAGLALTRQRGLEQLTLRSVADELGVTSPAVNYHVAGIDTLRDMVCEAVAATVDLSVDLDADWRDELVELIVRMDLAFARYPGVAERVLSLTSGSEAAAAITGKALDLARGAGLSERDATDLVAASHFLFTGWLIAQGMDRRGQVHPSLRSAGAPRARLTPDRLRRLVRALIDGFDTRRFDRDH